MIVPPGWVWVRADGDRDRTSRQLFKSLMSNGPRDSIGPFVHRLEEAFANILEQATEDDAVAVVMPIGNPWQVPVSTSIVLSMVTPDSGGLELPATDEHSKRMPTEAGEAHVTVRDEPKPADTESEDLVRLRSIEAVWVTPDKTGYLLATASIEGMPLAEYAPITEALTTLILTMLTALTWASDLREGSQS